MGGCGASEVDECSESGTSSGGDCSGVLRGASFPGRAACTCSKFNGGYVAAA